MKPWHPGCHHPESDPDNYQFCIFCLRKVGDDAKMLLARAHALLEVEGKSTKLVHEIADFLGWETHPISEGCHGK